MTLHLVLTATPLISHIRALCVLAVKIALDKDAIVTLLVSNYASSPKRVEAEVNRCISDHEGITSSGKLRVVAYGDYSVVSTDSVAARESAFEPVLRSLTAEKPITCSATGCTYDAAPKPSILLIDGFQGAFLQLARSIQPNLPVALWMIGFAPCGFCFIAPRHSGGMFELEDTIDTLQPKWKGDVLKIPGLLPMYDWEAYPQEDRLLDDDIDQDALKLTIFRLAHSVDLAVTAFFEPYEGEAIQACRSYFNETGRKLFNVGPVLALQKGTSNFSAASKAREIEMASGDMGIKIIKFLDTALKVHGPQSVVYISWGSFFWPVNSDFIVKLLEKLTEANVPFILSHGSPFAKIPEGVQKRYESSDIGILSPWSPQQSILAHKATGWFLTHCGYNSVIESLSQGVPMITWPISADQPLQAAHITHTLDVAFELIEVRTGEAGLKPMLTNGKTPRGTIKAFEEELDGLLRDMRGEVGERKRRNAQKLKKGFIEVWEEGRGSSDLELDALLARLET